MIIPPLPGGVGVWLALTAGIVLGAGSMRLWNAGTIADLKIDMAEHLQADAQLALKAEQQARSQEHEAQDVADALRSEPPAVRVRCEATPAALPVPAAGDGELGQPVPAGGPSTDVTAAVRELVAAAAANNGLAGGL